MMFHRLYRCDLPVWYIRLCIHQQTFLFSSSMHDILFSLTLPKLVVPLYCNHQLFNKNILDSIDPKFLYEKILMYKATLIFLIKRIPFACLKRAYNSVISAELKNTKNISFKTQLVIVFSYASKTTILIKIISLWAYAIWF